ncbi:MAG TPA: carotenoid biosynthesis protein [Anaerolineales bacterium]|nr:carotenoid biosynthesis protein [Anaerolineales bacterium]
MPLMIVAGVLAQVLAVGLSLGRASGWKAALLAGLPVLALAWLAEWLGSRTGFPFGRYSYTEALQPQLGGVPILVPFAWLMMLPPAWAIADCIVRPGQAHMLTSGLRLARAIVAGLAFAAWDLFIDPQMVKWGIWHWASQGAYFGIPWTNYAGWFLVAALISLFLAPERLPVTPLVFIYALTWFLTGFGQLFFWKLPGPAIYGFLGMGTFLLSTYLRRRT